ncbi:hypothetical protein DIE12_13830 [Burkholderia sp. Bp9015]|nr:hypothetical protein DIE20_26260 [Burkholderia sp. Bp9131]RQR73366.1 hypothetical protein DIE12_13830 [Burkholderia sp. Bp9015]
MAEDQAQAWANLVEITDVLNGISYEKAKEIAICIVELWRERVRIQFPGAEWQVNHIFDDDAEEVFVTMGRFSSGEGIGP